jgi:hypothetical protein
MRAKDEKGNVLGSMLDFLSVNEETGEMKVDSKVANFTEEDQNNFSGTLHRVLSSMHGEYSNIGESSIQRYSLGRMGLLFRKFMVPGFKRRWGKKYVNNFLQDPVEGYYRTFGRVAKWFMADMFHFKIEAMEALGRTGKYKLTDWERANMVRFAGEAAFLAISIAMSILLLSAKADEDDEKKKILLSNLAYQAVRLRAELMFYINPMATLQILRSPMATMNVIENSLKLLGQALYPIYSGTFEFDRYEQGNWKGHLKIEKTFNNLIPVTKQFYRIRDIGDQLSWFQQ